MKTFILASSLLISVAVCGVAHAHGDVKCDAGPKAEWRKQMELQKELTDKGWKVRQIKVENGCYEVYGFDAKGERVEAFFHPKTFERVDAKPGAGKALAQ
jgi:hypothetical protein